MMLRSVDLRVTRGGFGAKLHLSEVGVWKISAEAFAVEPRYRIAIALYPQGKMNIGKVDPLVAAKRCLRANQDVELRLPVANLVPDPRMTEALWAVEFLHFQDVSVELPRTFEIVNRNRKMMKAELVHGEPGDPGGLQGVRRLVAECISSKFCEKGKNLFFLPR
jgi:hypothetical protein